MTPGAGGVSTEKRQEPPRTPWEQASFPRAGPLLQGTGEAAVLRTELFLKGRGGAHRDGEPGRGAVFRNYLGFPSKPLSLCGGRVYARSLSCWRTPMCLWQLEQKQVLSLPPTRQGLVSGTLYTLRHIPAIYRGSWRESEPLGSALLPAVPRGPSRFPSSTQDNPSYLPSSLEEVWGVRARGCAARRPTNVASAVPQDGVQ